MSDVKAGQAYIQFGAKFGELQKAFRSIAQNIDGLQSRVARVSASIGNAGSNLRNFGLAATAPFVGAAIAGARFQDQMNAVRGITGATAFEFDDLNEKAKELGSSTSFSASEVASAMVELGRQGRSANEIISAIGPTLDTARAGAVSLAEAADLIGGTSNAFGKRDFSEVADILAKLANSSAQGFPDIQEALKFVAPAASDLKLSLEQTSVALGALANKQLKGSLAATSFNEVLRSLVDTQKVAKLGAEQYGISVADSGGNLRDPISVLRELEKAMSGLTSTARAAELTDLFGVRGAKAASIIMSTTASDIERLRLGMEEATGTSSKLAKEMDKGIGGAFRQSVSAIEGVAIQVAENLTPAIETLSSLVVSASNAIKEWAEENPNLTTTLAVVAVGATVAGTALISLGVAGKLAAVSMSLAATGMTTLSVAMAAFSIAAKGIAVVMGALKVAAATLATALGIATAPVWLIVGAVIAAVSGLLYFFDDFRNAIIDILRPFSFGLFGSAEEEARDTSKEVDGLTKSISDLEGQTKKVQKGASSPEGVMKNFSKATKTANAEVDALVGNLGKKNLEIEIDVTAKINLDNLEQQIKNLNFGNLFALDVRFEDIKGELGKINQRERGDLKGEILSQLSSTGRADPQSLASAVGSGLISQLDIIRSNRAFDDSQKVKASLNERFGGAFQQERRVQERSDILEQIRSKGFIDIDKLTSAIRSNLLTENDAGRALKEFKDSIGLSDEDKDVKAVEEKRSSIIGSFSGLAAFGASVNPMVSEQKTTNKILKELKRNTFILAAT